MCAQISSIICSYRTKRLPVIFRVHQNWIIQSFMIIKDRFQHLVLYLDHGNGSVHRFFCLSCHNRNRISYKSDMTIQNQTVIWTGFWISLSCTCKSSSVLVDILPCIDGLNSRNFHCLICLNLLHHRICMRGSEQFHDQTIFRDHIIHIYWLTGHKLHGIFFSDWLIYNLHDTSSFFFLPDKEILDSTKLSLIPGTTAQIPCQILFYLFLIRKFIFTE